MFKYPLTAVATGDAYPAEKSALCVHRMALAALNRVSNLPPMHGAMVAPAPEGFLQLATTLQPRSTCETDPSFLQLLPYVTIRREDTDQYFVYCRGKGGAEERLHGNLSIGVGGHVDTRITQCAALGLAPGVALTDHLVESATRELQEEVGYIAVKGDTLVYEDKLLYDDTNAVGQVHLGLLMHLDIADYSMIGDSEHGVIEGSQWLDLEDLRKPEVYDRLENWSKLAVDRLYAREVYSIVDASSSTTTAQTTEA